MFISELEVQPGGEHADKCKVCFEKLMVGEDLKEVEVCKHVYH